jgi:hypothetical protein
MSVEVEESCASGKLVEGVCELGRQDLVGGSVAKVVLSRELRTSAIGVATAGRMMRCVCFRGGIKLR